MFLSLESITVKSGFVTGFALLLMFFFSLPTSIHSDYHRNTQPDNEKETNMRPSKK
jgi:hypothetical protein